MRRSPVLAAILSLGLLSGCAVNKGSALAAAFDEAWAGTPDVTDIRTTGDNPLPFAGSATGELILAAGTPATRVTELAGQLREYVADHDNVTGKITADGITVTVVADETRAAEALTLWQSLATDDRVLDADLGDTTTGDVVRRRFRVTATDPAAVLAVFRDMVTDGGRHQPLPHVNSLAVQTARKASPYLHVQTAHDGTVPEQAIAAYEAVRAEFDVLSATVRAHRTANTAISFVLAPDADPAAAAELARSIAPALSDVIEVRTN